LNSATAAIQRYVQIN